MSKQKFWKKGCTVFIAVSMIVGSFTGCGTEEVKINKSRKTLKLWHYLDSSLSKQMLSDIADAFNDSQEEIQVEIQYVPDEDFKKHLALSMADGDMPELALVDSSDLKYFNEMQPLVEVTEQIENLDVYLPEATASCSIEGKMLGLPIGLNCTALFCNREMLQEQNLQVPETWDELQDTASKLTKDNCYGFAMPALRSEESVFSFLPLLWSYGGKITEIESEKSAEAFKKLGELSASGAMSPQTINLTSGDIERQFLEGNVAMVQVSSALQRTIQEEKPDMEYTMTLPPEGKASEERVTTIGGEVLVVTSGQKQKEALQFINYISKEEQLKICLDGTGYLAPREDILQEQIEESEELKNTYEIIQHARLREFSVDWPYVSIALTDAMEDEIVGEIPDNLILSNLAKKLQENREAK